MKPIYTTYVARHQGFSLLQALVSLIIFASITVAGLKWQSFTNSIDKGRNLGQQYLTLNAALNNYMVTYYQSLIKLKPICSEMSFTTTDPASAPSTDRNNTDCKLTIAAGKTVANGLQPNPAELITLGFLPASATVQSTNLLQIESPNLPTAKHVYEYIPTGTTHSGLSQPRLFINIEMVCVQRGSASNTNTGNAMPTKPDPIQGCVSNTTTTALTSLIFNTQPYNNDKKSYASNFPALLGTVFSTMGDDAVSSGITDVQLINSGSTLNGKNFQLNHPINGGPSGIMGLRGGYGASYTMQHSRVDGSNPPTADWGFGGYGITSGLSKLKLPLQTLGAVCDGKKEDISLDKNATVLTCKNNMWSKSSSDNAGTMDVREYILITMTNLKPSAFRPGDASVNISQCVYGTCTYLPIPMDGLFINSSYAGSSCVTLYTIISAWWWHYQSFEGYQDKVFVSAPDFTNLASTRYDANTGDENSFQYKVRICTGNQGDDLFSGFLKFYKINQ
jgi:type II secretory pathway pseudopilin PulG